jgi:hypothetical protein
MKGKRPARRRGTFRNPPPNFPADPELYGDPENWKYPLDTPRRARLARRFFSMERSRQKYSEMERAFIDDRIDATLKEFGIDPEEVLSTAEGSERVPDVDFPDDVDLDSLTLDDLLLHFVGMKRMESSKAIPDDRLEIEKATEEYIVARVKEYLIKLDIKSRLFAHDCGDWIAWMSRRLLCKHVAKLLTTVDQRAARAILLDLYEHGEDWTFSSRPREVFA